MPADGPAYGLDFARHREFLLRAPQAHVSGSSTCGAVMNMIIVDDMISTVLIIIVYVIPIVSSVMIM